VDTAAHILSSGQPANNYLHTFGSSCGARNPLVDPGIVISSAIDPVVNEFLSHAIHNNMIMCYLYNIVLYG